jgi:hypothetical protein
MESNIIELESEFHKLESDIKNNKDTYMDHIYEVILKNVKDHKFIKKRISLFKFINTNLVVIVSEHQYKLMCENLLQYYVDNESYEKCSKLYKIVNNIG